MRSLAVLTTLVFLLLGCGGSDSDSGSGNGTESSTTSTSPVDDSVTTTTAQSTTTDGGSATFSPERCPEFAQWAADAAAATQAAFTGGGTNAAGLAFTADYFQQFADQAPSEIRDDMQVFADAFSGFYDTLGALNIDFSDPASLATLDAATVQQLEAAASLMDTSEVEQATDNVRAFFERECS